MTGSTDRSSISGQHVNLNSKYSNKDQSVAIKCKNNQCTVTANSVTILGTEGNAATCEFQGLLMLIA
jgi:hypothetical protein